MKTKKYVVCAVDTEDDSKGNIYLINFYDGNEHFTFTRKIDAVNFICNSKYTVFVAHNLEYDLTNIFYPAFIHLIFFYYNKSSLIYARLTGSKKLFLDTFNFSFASLKTIGRFIGHEKIDVEGDFNNIEYCRRDTEICYKYFDQFRFMVKHNFDLDNSFTLAGTSQKIFKTWFNDYKILGLNADDEILNFYFGGRTEMFYKGDAEKVWEIDVNSMYPYCMQNDYPAGEYYKTREPREKFYLARVKIKIRPCDIPIIPVRHEKALYFSTGEFEAYTNNIELETAIKYGQVEKVEYIETYNFPETAKVFLNFITHFWQKRLQAKQEGNEFNSQFYKLVMNSLYGRLALKGGLEKVVYIGDEKEISPLSFDKTRTVNYALPVFVTAYARIKLFEMFQKVKNFGGKVLYSDTDSCYFTLDKSSGVHEDMNFILRQIPVDQQLGNFSCAYYPHGTFYGLKQYILTNIAQLEKIKAKGIPAKFQKEFLTTDKTSYLRPVRLRSSYIQNLVANYWKEYEVEKRSNYKKRVVLPDGNTCPVNLNNVR